MDENKQKEGFTVKEIESFAKKHCLEVFFCLSFVLACLFSFMMWRPGWSIFACTIGAILGVLLAGKIAHFSKKIFHFVFRQEKTTQLVLAIVGLILAVFLPPLYFLLIGLHGGKDMYHKAMETHSDHNR